ncbi:tail assembly protein, partial [Salmonella enterica subsp. enterica serovar Rissen str. 150]|nr:tail assembly protein [Salmonella enterica subsp. enterica serovar Tennessee]EDR0792403.1 tail assembly protein [Salmonella enterica subsp. enterica serovar Rissen str. 150]MID66433.1 tail assembly protein [Salmonella enterica subsp. enterica serovar Tennessee]
IAVAVSVASIAYSVYMSRNMKTKTSAEAAETNTLTNNSFTSAENRVGQGRPVPVLLGEMEVGSNVISLGIDTSNNQDWTESIS